MLLHQPYDGIQLHAAESTGTLQGHRRRLAPIQRHEEEPIGTYSENRRYAIAILPHRLEISTNGPRTVADRPGHSPAACLTLRRRRHHHK